MSVDPSGMTATTSHGGASVTIADGPALLVARIAGEVDLANTAEIHARLVAAYRHDIEAVEIDLRDVTYLDSAGLAMLVRLSERLHAARTVMTVAAPEGSPAHRVITLTGLAAQVGLAGP